MAQTPPVGTPAGGAERDILLQKLNAILRVRLEPLMPLVDTWPQACALLALPQNLPRTIHTSALMVDEMWRLAGDTSLDVRVCVVEAGLSLSTRSKAWC